MSYKYGTNPDPYPYPPGTLIRYETGPTALCMITSDLHVNGYHAKHCMGGIQYCTHDRIRKAYDEDYKTWVLCEKWRK